MSPVTPNRKTAPERRLPAQTCYTGTRRLESHPCAPKPTSRGAPSRTDTIGPMRRTTTTTILAIALLTLGACSSSTPTATPPPPSSSSAAPAPNTPTTQAPPVTDPYQAYLALAPADAPQLTPDDAQARAMLGCGTTWAPGTVDAALQQAYAPLIEQWKTQGICG